MPKPTTPDLFAPPTRRETWYPSGHPKPAPTPACRRCGWCLEFRAYPSPPMPEGEGVCKVRGMTALADDNADECGFWTVGL